MVQTALIAVFLILFVTFLSSPSKKSKEALTSQPEMAITTQKDKNNVVETSQIIEIKTSETSTSKVDVVIPGIPVPVALPKVVNVLDFKDTVKLLELLEQEKRSNEEMISLNKRLKKELKKKEENEAKLKAQLAKMTQRAELAFSEASAKEEEAKKQIADLEKRLLDNMHYQKSLQAKIESFPEKVDKLVNIAEEISTKAESEYHSLLSEKEALSQELEALKKSQK